MSEYLTVKDIAMRTRLSVQTVRNAIAARDLEAVRVKGYRGSRGSIRIPVDAYRKWENAAFQKI